MDKAQETLGDRLKIVRGAMPQAEFAHRLGADKNTVGRYERGERHPDSEYLAAVRTEFSINLDWLISGEGEMRPGGAEAPRPAIEGAPAEIDTDLCGEISEYLSDIYRECGVPVTLRQVVAEAARIAADLSGPDVTPEGRAGAVKYALIQLRRQLLVANVAATPSKSSA
jgi:transcriptional regulator with XRE-family HTH domain